MITLSCTLLTLAVGMLLGKAAAFQTEKKWQKIVGLPILFCLCMIIAVWCDKQMHPASLMPIISESLNVGLMLYGILSGYVYSIHLEVEYKKRSDIAITFAILFAKLPPILFVILIFFKWGVWETALISVGGGLLVASIIFLAFHFVWVLKYGFTTKQVS